ncbi:hypothetical protein NIES2119_01035 [[Phormidium ambiguum] IAM M-71]|uniref:Uncharacterized protein n=1 Tax=[Phormidium ambiguum] IAM M-71 TaxID=454136 RepID=A0A1U7ITW5_9CYAN|nr:hypothetical protein [Phormidium ambiguum]OKH40924.1 hypothetical protein NIES2119_01035 [Phormidium ambiguum IAM M-71]
MVCNYIFTPATQALLEAGKLIQSTTKAGQLLPMVIDPTTGKIVEIAKAACSSVTNTLGMPDFFRELTKLVGNTPIQPLVAPAQLIMGPAQMIQIHRGFQVTYKKLDAIQASLQTLQSSVGVLQATTAVIGVGVTAGVVLSAVNLYQTLKLRKEVEQLRLEVKDGFIDLKKALTENKIEIIQHIDQVAKDIKFEAHRLILIQAYGQFQQALRLIKNALAIEDQHIRNTTLGNAQLLLANALANYNSPQILEDTSAVGYLRRVECAWAIEQTMALTYQLQNASAVVSDSLAHLQQKIRQDTLIVTERCKSQEELDFLFPEIARIHSQDLVVLETWQNQVDWMQSLSTEDLKQLANDDLINSPIPNSQEQEANQQVTALAEPPEQLLYEKLRQISHFRSLHDQLRFLVKPELRKVYESYISQQAKNSNYDGLSLSNWQEITDLTVANLYWYFKKPKPSFT